MAATLPCSRMWTNALPARRGFSVASRMRRSSASMSSSSPRAFCASGLPMATRMRSGPGMLMAGAGPAGVDPAEQLDARVQRQDGVARSRSVSHGRSANGSAMSSASCSVPFSRSASAIAASSAAVTAGGRKASASLPPTSSRSAFQRVPPGRRACRPRGAAPMGSRALQPPVQITEIEAGAGRRAGASMPVAGQGGARRGRSTAGRTGARRS